MNKTKSWKIIPTYVKWTFIVSLLAAVGTSLTNRVFLAYGKIIQGQTETTYSMCVWERNGRTAYYLSLGSLQFRGVSSQQGHCNHEIQNCKYSVQPKQQITAKTPFKIQFKQTHTDTFRHLRIDTYCTYPCLRLAMVVLPKL